MSVGRAAGPHGADPHGADPRTAEIAGRLAAVRDRIAAACRAVGRPLDAVTLVAVTKTFPADDVRRLATLGVRDVGENRDREAAAKAAACADLPLRWHFVGQLQTNKAASVAAYAHLIHSVDRPRLVAALDGAAAAAGRRLDVLIQVALGDDPGTIGPRGGADPAAVPGLAAAVAATTGLTLRGVMAVPPVAAEPARAYATLARIAADLRREHPGADLISAGMSADLEPAIAGGATHVRVGSAVLGPRPSLG